VARRSPWFSLRTKSAEPNRTTEDATGAFLIPFLAILGVGIAGACGVRRIRVALSAAPGGRRGGTLDLSPQL